jgi:ribosome-associated protein
MDLQGVVSFTDYFVICTGSSDRMLNALADGAIDLAREKHQVKARPQGEASAGWVIVDFSNVILHVFAPEQRAYYNLEELWHEGKTLLKLQ